MFFVSLGLFIILHLTMVYDARPPPNQEAKGFLLLPSVKKVVAENPELTCEKLVKESEYNPFDVQEAWTVYTSRGVILAVWLLVFWSLTCACSAFLHLFP